MVKGVSYTYTYCDHFTVHTNTESLCCALQTHIMLSVNYISNKKKTIINSIKKQTTKWDNIGYIQAYSIEASSCRQDKGASTVEK